MSADLQFLFGQYVPRCNHRIDKHFEDYCVLQFIDGGAVEFALDSRVWVLSGRWFFSSFPGPRIAFHVAKPGETWVHRYLAFRGSRVTQWMADGLFPLEPQQPPAGEDYARKFDELLELSRRTDRWGHARAVLAIETILTELAEARGKPQATPTWLESAVADMQRLGAAIDFEHMAREAGMSVRSFRRRFSAAMGMSPRAYAIGCRIAHAREMLGATELPIKSIAEQLGYSDVFFFSRQFTRFAGISPAAYRRTKEA
jgi:AraC-like DNA-binding protein